MCEANCPHGEKGGLFMFSMSIVFRGGGLHVFHGNFFLGGGGGCLKAPRSQGMDGWVTGGFTIGGGGFFQ